MDDVTTPVRERRWSNERIARLGFLVGLGWNSKRIACDSIISANPRTVLKHAHMYRLSFRAVRSMSFQAPQIPRKVVRVFDVAADKRSITREMLVKMLFLELAREPNLLDNILDDQQ
jgi:hypothetical protein